MTGVTNKHDVGSIPIQNSRQTKSSKLSNVVAMSERGEEYAKLRQIQR